MKIDQDLVPPTIKSAVDRLITSLDEADRNFIRFTNNPCAIHYDAGRSIRNDWSLWSNDTPLKRDAATTYGIAHADDISGLIWAWVWAIVRSEYFDPEKHCEQYHKHWAKFGLDPLVAGGWSKYRPGKTNNKEKNNE